MTGLLWARMLVQLALLSIVGALFWAAWKDRA
jgi:hypothetical protein